MSDDETLAVWSRYASLHMSLAPYFRGLAQVAHDTGVSIGRGLAVEFPEDETVWPIADEVLVGSSVLIAPVQVQGATSRDVYLPNGNWFPWSGGAAVAGGKTIHVDVPLSEIAVYARAGSIVPTYPDGVQTLVIEPSSVENAGAVKGDRVVYAFAGGAGSFDESPDAGGISYTLETADASVAPSWNGAPLSSCATPAVAPCFENTDTTITAHVTGPGALIAGGAKLTCIGGDAARSLVLVLRH